MRVTSQRHYHVPSLGLIRQLILGLFELGGELGHLIGQVRIRRRYRHSGRRLSPLLAQRLLSVLQSSLQLLDALLELLAAYSKA